MKTIRDLVTASAIVFYTFTLMARKYPWAHLYDV